MNSAYGPVIVEIDGGMVVLTVVVCTALGFCAGFFLGGWLL